MQAEKLCWLLGLAWIGCRSAPQDHRSLLLADAPSTESALPEAGRPRTAELLELENRRMNGGITEADLAEHDPAVRRSATRALARSGNPMSVAMLLEALPDEDPEVVAFSAYGLGYVCRSDGVPTSEIVRALATRGATLPAEEHPLDPHFAIARALARCASDEAERTLAIWLSGWRPLASFAALGLGDLASRKKTLSQPTQVALLAAAAGFAATAPLPEALYPFGRFDHPLATVTDRLLEIALLRIADPGPARLFAVRALARTSAAAVPPLQRILTSADGFTAVERIEAARGLAKLGAPGQQALAESLASMVPAHDPHSLGGLQTASFGPLLVTLQSLHDATLASKRRLFDLAGLGIPADASAPLARRITMLRCRAAALLVNGGAEDPLLLRCDPEEGGELGERAQLEVIGRRPLEGRRLVLFRNLAASKHLRVREAAIELLASHPEVPDLRSIIEPALAAREPGLVATAAELVSAHPERATAPEIASQLQKALERDWTTDGIEALGALLEAAGAIRLDAATPTLALYCQHQNPTLREHAARGLALLQSSKVTCASAKTPGPAAAELEHLAQAEIKLELTTDAGTLGLVLDPTAAPVAVTRFADLARAGFYDGVAAHRVVPGFVVQFGDPGGDGFGGGSREPLRCETTPTPFEPFDVGVALAGRDTGGSQMFVTLARFPHLDQEYAWVGRATGDWAALAEGDLITTVKVLP